MSDEGQGGALGDPTTTLTRKLAWLRDVEVSWWGPGRRHEVGPW